MPGNDRRFLAWFLTMAISSASIIGSAPANAQEPLEERVAKLEVRVRALEVLLARLAERDGGTSPALHIDTTGAPITVVLVSKRFYQGNVRGEIQFQFEFASRLPKTIRAFTGVVVLRDLFDRDVMGVSVTVEDPLVSGGTVSWGGSIDYNQHMDTHRRLRSISQSDLRARFQLEQVIYQDGTRQRFGRS